MKYIDTLREELNDLEAQISDMKVRANEIRKAIFDLTEQ